MEIESEQYGVGFVLIVLSMILSWVTAFSLGGFKMGDLEKRISFPVPQADLAAFLERFHQRLGELGFKPDLKPGHFVQGGSDFNLLGVHTHAKSRKLMVLTLRNDGQSMTVELALRFLQFVISDSGESAYRDAALNYVSGATDRMNVVPNRNYSALSCLVGGVLAWVSLLIMQFTHSRSVWVPIAMLGGMEIFTGILAIVAIRQKPQEQSGTGLAIGGILAAASAVTIAFLLTIANLKPPP